MSNIHALGDYETDIVGWSEKQADALRRRAGNELDWDNVAEEIESVGNEQRNAVESLLTNILSHLLQLTAWPQVAAAPHWRHEVAAWRVQVARRLKRAPKLRAEMERELIELYADVIRVMSPEVDGVPRPSVPDVCPWTLDQAITQEFWPG